MTYSSPMTSFRFIAQSNHTLYEPSTKSAIVEKCIAKDYNDLEEFKH